MARYASSDWHGNGALADKVLDFLKEGDELFYLGDAVDRGPEGMYILKRLLNDDRVFMLMGNHEDLMLDVAPHLLYGDRKYKYKKGWFNNGGRATWEEMLLMSEEEVEDILTKVSHLPYRYEFKNKQGQYISLSHAGFNPWIEPDIDMLLWDRSHIDTRWREEYNNYYVIHGHTPVNFMPDLKDNKDCDYNIIRYTGGHKIDIDLGSAWSNKTCLINLDNLDEVIYFGL